MAERESQVVLGLDPGHTSVAAGRGGGARRRVSRRARRRRGRGALRGGRRRAGPACVATVKPQLACFERLGAPGWRALQRVVEHAQEQGLLVLADAKRGDIDVSAAAYAQALAGETATPFGTVPGLGVDAYTASPYLGLDSLRAVRAPPAGVFVLVRTSNPGAVDVGYRHRGWRARVGARRAARRRPRRARTRQRPARHRRRGQRHHA